jgi:hypothetical protein
VKRRRVEHGVENREPMARRSFRRRSVSEELGDTNIARELLIKNHNRSIDTHVHAQVVAARGTVRRVRPSGDRIERVIAANVAAQRVGVRRALRRGERVVRAEKVVGGRARDADVVALVEQRLDRRHRRVVEHVVARVVPNEDARIDAEVRVHETTGQQRAQRERRHLAPVRADERRLRECKT